MRLIRWSSSTVRKLGRPLIALLIAPVLLAGTATIATAPVKPVEAAFCGLNSWTLTYHDSLAWWVEAVGYDQYGNPQDIWVHTYLASTWDPNHCWLENTTVALHWYDDRGGYISDTSKQLVPLCYQIANVPMFCADHWNALAQVWGP